MMKKASIHISLLLAFCAASAAQTAVFTELANLNPYYHAYWGLVQGLNGQLYSTTSKGSTLTGEVFAITTGGQVTGVHTLAGNSQTGVMLATDGNFYGTTYSGGLYGSGTVFRVSPNGSLTRLHSFCAQTGCPDGAFPLGPLTQATDGNLYGTTTAGGPACPVEYDACGTVFRMTLAGELTTIYTFCLQAGCPDGSAPDGAIVLASDGNIYGTAGGGPGGEIYRLTPSGVITVLYSFCEQAGCPDGLGPSGGLSEGPDGALYGATQSFPTIFKITLDGAFQVLSKPGGAADSPPVPATDGNLYGTIAGGGANGSGAIYKITTSGALTVLYSFCPMQGCKDGAAPFGPPFQATDGNLYGTTFGPVGPPGTVWRLSLGLAPFVSPLPAYGKAGGRISILGTDLAGATAVSFNGTPAGRFAVNSTGSAISTGVPKGATTGPIQVTLANGTVLSSNVPFQVER
jgi:uncharacterized repeat protein (TIGR03803 family)